MIFRTDLRTKVWGAKVANEVNRAKKASRVKDNRGNVKQQK